MDRQVEIGPRRSAGWLDGFALAGDGLPAGLSPDVKLRVNPNR